ncbi:KH domain RNA binding protein [Helicobacter pylori Hp H-16]|nr:KH domain RNA binding protein [Helicobacter pylori Hp H-16]
MGHVIGKEGKMVSAIKAFVSGVKAKDGFSYKIVVFASNDKNSDKNPHALGDQTP